MLLLAFPSFKMDALNWKELSFEQLVRELVPTPFEGTLLALDPGETTGYAVFKNQTLVEADQASTKPIETGTVWLREMIKKHSPTFIVYESYRVYSWKAQSHAFSDLHTPQFIGTILTFCAMHQIPHVKQTAQMAKWFVTDEKLKLWGFYTKSLKHARDALRHGALFQLHTCKRFGPNKNS